MKAVRAKLVLLLIVGMGLTCWTQIPPPDTGKLSWDLYQLAAAGRTKRAADEEVPQLTALLVTVQAATEDDLAGLQELGYEVIGAIGAFVLVQAEQDLFLHETRGMDALDFVVRASLPPETLPTDALPAASRDPITDGTAWIGAPEAWEQGYRGQGARIAVIDVEFDTEHPVLVEAEAQFVLILPSGEKPGAYRAVPGAVGRVGNHGTSCGIIAHDVAPDAELFLLSYPQWSGLVGWLLALRYAVHTLGVDVVSSSVEFGAAYSHADGTGQLNESVESILDGTQSILVQAAGNWAAGAGSSQFFYAGTFTDADGDFRHNFTPDADDEWTRNTLQFNASAGDRVSIVLEWDAWGHEEATVDLDLYLYDHVYREIVAISRAQQFGYPTAPVEHIDVILPYTGEFSIIVQDRGGRWHDSPCGPVRFHLNVFNRARRAFTYVEHHSVCGSVREVAASSHPGVMSVGAVNMSDGTVWHYSSRGPTSDGRAKPDIHAPAGVTGTTYLPVYHGTSAAAPYAAGAIAVLRSAMPEADREAMIDGLLASGAALDDGCGNPVVAVELAGLAELAEVAVR